MITVIYLWRIDLRKLPLAIWHMAADRRLLRANKELGFFKLLGTGTGESFTPRDVNPRLWGLLITIEESSFETFDADPVVRSWRKFATSEVRYVATAISAHGKWSRTNPFNVDNDLRSTWTGQVLALTRARIKWRKNLAFWRAVPLVISSLRGSQGLERAIGIGEAPIGLQGTLSIWSDSQSLEDFAFKGSAHSTVIKQTHSEGWYAEELFARFALIEVRSSTPKEK